MSGISSTDDYIAFSLVKAMIFDAPRTLRSLVIGETLCVMWEPRFFADPKKHFGFDLLNRFRLGLFTVPSVAAGDALENIERPAKIIGFGRFTILKFGPKNTD